MNRREHRSIESQRTFRAGQSVAELFERAVAHHAGNELAAAAQLYRKALDLKPGLAAARERLGLILVAQGKLDKAAEQYAALARLAPQTLADFGAVAERLKALVPPLAVALASGSTVSPVLLTDRKSPAGQDVRTILGNPYLRVVLESTVVRDRALERWLTSVRAAILRLALDGEAKVDSETVAFCAALAQQCFINEYVFRLTPAEAEQVEGLKAQLDGALANDAIVPPLQLLALSTYVALDELAHSDALIKRAWRPPLADVVGQQVVELREERQLRATIPQLTPIAEGVSARVREQYEENPYPRWARLGAPPSPPLVLDEHLRILFPTAPFRPIGKGENIDALVAGCGTGRHTLEYAQAFQGMRVLGLDLSVASLASAKRRIPPALAGKVEFAQADILALGSLGRTFDFISAGGVLHHMDDPLAGWRELLKLMRPDALMQVGLYSAHARRDIVAARAMIGERGYQPTPDGIRRCRQDLLDGEDNFPFMRLDDFFTVSACRDLLFHVHERQLTIPEIKAFLAENDMRFIGFEFSPSEAHQHYRNLFARNGWSISDLDRWDGFERENPQLFAGMYIFWIQKK